MNPELSLVVLKTPKMEEMLSVYRAIGLAFAREQHGSGPVHHSCNLGATVLEIYPGDDKVASSTRLGFRVESVDSTVDGLSHTEASVVKPPTNSQWGRCAVITDPDGRTVEIISKN